MDGVAPKVTMVDLTDHTLHACGNVNMTTACGIRLDEMMVGATYSVMRQAERICTDCFPEGLGYVTH